MAKKVVMNFMINLTFDVDAKGDTGVYKEVSELLEKNGLLKSVTGNPLPDNVYYGYKDYEVIFEGNSPTLAEIKKQSDNISVIYHKLLHAFFTSKGLKFKIFVVASRSSTSAFRYTK